MDALTALSEDPRARAVGIILLALLLSVLVDMLARTLLLRLTRATETELDDKLLALFRPVVNVSIVMAGLFWVLTDLDLVHSTRIALRGVGVTVLVLWWARVLTKGADLITEGLSVQDGDTGLVQESTVPVFHFASRLIVWGGASYFILLAWHVDVTAWLASAGIVGIAVGFAAQDTLANLFAGVFILADRPYKLGDFLLLPDGKRGEVTYIGIRTTRLLTHDDVEIVVPNAEMATTQIVNASGGPREAERVTCIVECAYGADIDQVRALLVRTTDGIPHIVRDDPEKGPRARFMEFGANGLVWHVQVWVEEPRTKFDVIDLINSRIYKAMNEAGLEIPFPKRDLYLHRQGD